MGRTPGGREPIQVNVRAGGGGRGRADASASSARGHEDEYATLMPEDRGAHGCGGHRRGDARECDSSLRAYARAHAAMWSSAQFPLP
jgi:hypothetical protein